MRSSRLSFICIMLASSGLLGCSAGGTLPAVAPDLAAIRAASAAYEAAWLANDPEAVMATLTEDAVILPSGLPPKAGHAAIRAFWFPADAPATIVTRFDATQDEAGGQGDLAYVRGTFTLAFRYDGADYASGGTYLTLLRRAADGAWRISHRMWSDRPRQD